MLTNARMRKYHATLTRKALAEYRLMPTTVVSCAPECGLTRAASPVTVFDVIPQRSEAASRADVPIATGIGLASDSKPKTQWCSSQALSLIHI